MKISFDSKTNDKIKTIVIFAHDTNKLTDAAKNLDKKLNGIIKKAIKSDHFSEKSGDFVIITAPTGSHYDRIILAGTGKHDKITTLSVEKLGNRLFDELNKKSKEAQIICDFSGKNITTEEVATALATGMMLNSYRFNKYFTKKEKKHEDKLDTAKIVVKNSDKAHKLFDRQHKLIKGVFLARDLVTETPNVLYPESYAQIIKKELAPLGIEVKILGRKEIKKLGMGALASVGQGSMHEEKLVVMNYKGGKKAQKPIAFVGKGITFDSGGISLKPGAGMWDMKYDMGGSAAVVGLMKTIALRKAKANIVGVVALAENMPSSHATRPSDIVKTMSGQTVEILNTDAEGRLILCDALSYVQDKYKPTQIIDLATLTGAILTALGHEYAGGFTNDDKLVKDVIQSGKEVDELLWQMPMSDAWDKELDSQIADIRNISTNGGKGGSSIAAHFLKRFIKKDVKWLHIDIAGMAWAYTKKNNVPKGASGFGVRLLDNYVEKFCEK